MPIYDFFCEECDDVFAIQKGISDEVYHCIRCRSDKIKRVWNYKGVIKSPSSTSKKIKPGKVVKEFIENTKKEIEDRKSTLKKWSPKK